MTEFIVPTIWPASENSLLLTWPESICVETQQAIAVLSKMVKRSLSSVIIEQVSSYNSLLIYYRFEDIAYTKIIDEINQCIQQCQAKSLDEKKEATPNNAPIEIPVYYHSWDLQSVAKKLSLSIEQIITLHSQTTYTAYAHGFTPGFCYLTSVDEKIRLPRQSTPRTAVPAGAVAIAEQQTAVYPSTSPGGWHILGLTPQPMFKIIKQSFKPAISLGQQVRFNPISEQQFLNLGGELDNSQAGKH